MASHGVIELTDETFDAAVQQSSIPVLVDFWADDCPPCARMAPVLVELAKEYDGRLRIAKLNAHQNQEAAVRFGVMSVPTFLLFKNGVLANQFRGAVPKGTLIDVIEEVL